MFTGIVQGLVPVVTVEDTTGLRRLVIDLGDLAAELAVGASVAVNGTCLTATSAAPLPPGQVAFDVIRETLERTNLGTLQAGDRVNVERSFRVGDEVGGHILSGHVAATARVARVIEGPNERTIVLRVPAEWVKYLSLKGFVALDGASLTIADLDTGAGELSVSLIPETIARTTLGRVTDGDRVNLEVDAQTQTLVDTVERLLSQPEWRARFA